MRGCSLYEVVFISIHGCVPMIDLVFYISSCAVHVTLKFSVIGCDPVIIVSLIGEGGLISIHGCVTMIDLIFYISSCAVHVTHLCDWL